MKNWTGKFCRASCWAIVGAALFSGCSTSQNQAASREEVKQEESLRTDKTRIEELRKDVPDEIKKSNDRLADSLKRWKILKTPPEILRERFNDEIQKMRMDLDKKQRHAREDFNRSVTDRRKEFQDKQKEDRENFFGSKPTSAHRQNFMDQQSVTRDRFNDDLRDERDTFEDDMKAERKIFEDDIASRWTEFRQEYPEYTRLYNEMKAAEERQQEEQLNNPKPYTSWPYKADDAAAAPSKSPNPIDVDVNKGGDGWPKSDPSEFDQMDK